MFLERLIAVIEKFDERLANIERAVKATESKVRDISGAVGSPTGELKFKGMMRPSADELKQAFQDKSMIHMESVEMEATFSHALYMSICPENRDKIRELLAPQQINYLKKVLEQHKKLNELAGWAEEFMNNATQNLEDRKVEIQKSIEQAILSGNNSVVERLRIDQDRSEKQESRIDIALRNCNEAARKAEASTAKANNIITTNQRAGRKKFSKGANS